MSLTDAMLCFIHFYFLLICLFALKTKANSLLCENLFGKKTHSDSDSTTDGKRQMENGQWTERRTENNRIIR